MVLDLLLQLVPWFLGFVIIILIILILRNKKRLYEIRNSGRISEIIDRRRNIVFYTILIVMLFIGILVDIFSS